MRRRDFIESFLVSAVAIGAKPLLAGPRSEREISDSDGSLSPLGQNANADQTPRQFFYRPVGAWPGDFIPYYRDGQFHLFFLMDWRDKAGHGEGTPWYQVITKDFVHFDEHGEMLPRGSKKDQDLYVFTGSVVYGEGKHHIFYTGHNPYFPDEGKPQEGVMHATSDDLLHWEKIPEDTFYAPSERFELNDWRDPFVFWNPEAREYWMIVAARLKSGPSRRRGCSGLCASKDLRKWEVRDPFWSPGLYFTHECPDLFKMGDWWYLLFSEFTDLVRTRYRMSRSLNGPWLTPKYDYFDAKAFYAAKTASDGQRRFLFGWDPTRTGGRDYHPWDWGGNLVVHELRQESDGTLAVTIPATVDAAFTRPLPAQFPLQLGQVKVGSNQVELVAPKSFGCAAAEMMPDRCKIEAQVQFDPHTRGCGIMLRTSDDLEASYYIRLEPQNRRMVFDSWPRVAPEPLINVDGGHMAGLDRWLDLAPGVPVDLKVIVDRTTAVVYASGGVAMSLRMYDLPTGRWGFFVDEGSAQFHNIRITAL
jgi:beta-fructofuranosidase